MKGEMCMVHAATQGEYMVYAATHGECMVYAATHGEYMVHGALSACGVGGQWARVV